jgi:predicted glycosyltransferase
MSKEILKHGTILEALNEYKKTIDSGAMYNEKVVQETIYQIEDLANNKAIIRNKNQRPDTISGNIILECYDVYKMFKYLINNANSPIRTSLLDSKSNVPVKANVSLRYNESWDEPRRVEEVILTLIDTLEFTMGIIPDAYLKAMKKKMNEELKRRKEINEVASKTTERILEDNIDG